MSQAKVFNKGQVILKEGEKITNLYFIQTGSVNLQWPRGKKAMEYTVLGPGQVIGDFCLAQSVSPVQAVAVTEVKVLELPLEAFLKQWESLPQPVKIFGKSMADRMKWAQTEIKNYKLEKEASPCGEDVVAKVFAAFFYSFKVKAKSESTKTNQIYLRAEWPLVRQYAQRIFGESPKRIEQVLNILVKHQIANLKMGPPPENPEGPDEIREVTMNSPETIEKFFEFYQYFYFKGGKQDPLKFDDLLFHLMTQFIELGERFPDKDRQGVVNIPYSEVLKSVKDTLGTSLNNDHFLRFDSKGIMVNRKTMTNGEVYLQFQPAELIQNRWNWIFLREIERWNEKGFVDVTESVLPKKPSVSGESSSGTMPCPDCKVEVAMTAKFCHECGCKLTKAA